MGWIRLLLALSVVLLHVDSSRVCRLFGSQLVRGQAAVQAFYVISGFYMALVLTRKYPRGAGNYFTFMGARVMRLAPAYVAVLALAVALPAMNLLEHPAYERWRVDGPNMTLPTKLLYAGSQATLIGQDAVWFTSYDRATGRARFDAQPPIADDAYDASAPTRDGMGFLFVGQAWTLGVELLFYLVAPFVVRRLGTIGICFVASLAVRAVMSANGYNRSPWTYRFFPSELAFFLIGSTAYHAFDWFERTGRARLLRASGYVALPALLAVILFLFELDIPMRSVILIAATAVCLPSVFALTKSQKVDRWVGELSYPIYIGHELVRLLLVTYAGGVTVTTMMAGSLTFAVALLMLVEQPVDRLRARIVARRLLGRAPPPDDAAPPSAAASADPELPPEQRVAAVPAGVPAGHSIRA